MSETRWLARKDNITGVATELDWINSRTRILGESFGAASNAIQASIDDGTMIVVTPPAEDSESVRDH